MRELRSRFEELDALPAPGLQNLIQTRVRRLQQADTRAVERNERSRHEKRRVSAWITPVIAALAVAALGVGLALVFQYARTANPARHTPPSPVKSSGVGVCSRTCGIGIPLFVSSHVGWLTESLTPDPSSPACNPACPTSVIFRTGDGGSHWAAEFSWQGWAQQILASPDGQEVLVVPQADHGGPLLHSTDAGAHWTSLGLPPTAGQATQAVCKFGTCLEQNIVGQVYFLNPREGWVFSQEPTFTLADLFHTTDSGAHWSLIRVDLKAQFNLDMVKGLTPPSGTDHSLHGQVIFRDSSTGWFVSDGSWDLYVTHDGGATWRIQSLPRPVGMEPDRIAFIDSLRFFSNRKNGVLNLHVRTPEQIGPAAAQSDPYRYVYTTTDGGDHWSNSSHPPSVAIPGPGVTRPSFVDVSIDFIDAAHWVGWPVAPAPGPAPTGGLMRTSDEGKHWDVLPGSLPNLAGWFQFLDSSRGWAYVTDSSGFYLYRTTDGGVNWTPLSLPELG